MTASLQNDDSGPAPVRWRNGGRGAAVMPPAFTSLARFPAVVAFGDRRRASLGLLVALHVAAAAILVWSEADWLAQVSFVLAWSLFNLLGLLIVRRPLVTAAVTLILLVVLVLLSQLKYQALFQTVSFVDVMIVDLNTIRFCSNSIRSCCKPSPSSRRWRHCCLSCCGGSTRCASGARSRSPAAPSASPTGGRWLRGAAGAQRGILRRQLLVELRPLRGGCDSEFATHGYMDSEPVVADRLKSMDTATCTPARQPPHIIVVHDESSFDARAIPGIKLPAGYGQHFRSFDGRERHFMVEGAGGPSWYTEFNVFAGLSARSFGRFAYFVTRIAAGRVKRGLPNALRRCGYRTYSLYPWLGAFMGRAQLPGFGRGGALPRYSVISAPTILSRTASFTMPRAASSRANAAKDRCSSSPIWPPTTFPGRFATGRT